MKPYLFNVTITHNGQSGLMFLLVYASNIDKAKDKVISHVVNKHPFRKEVVVEAVSATIE